jgi:hypothetical protein
MLPISFNRHREEVILGRLGPLPFWRLHKMGERERGEHCHVIGAPGMGKTSFWSTSLFRTLPLAAATA